MLLPSTNPTRRRVMSLSLGLAAQRIWNLHGAGCKSNDNALFQID